MDTIGIRDLRADLPATLRRAGNGERILVTVNGRAIAQLGPIEPTDGKPTLEDLAARGLIILPARPDRPEPELSIELWAGMRLDRLMAELRGR